MERILSIGLGLFVLSSGLAFGAIAFRGHAPIIYEAVYLGLGGTMLLVSHWSGKLEALTDTLIFGSSLVAFFATNDYTWLAITGLSGLAAYAAYRTPDLSGKTTSGDSRR
jgi:hypothetical protein